MSRRRFVTLDELAPYAPTPCFCDSCMALGGQARIRLRAKWLQSLRGRPQFRQRGEAQAERPR